MSGKQAKELRAGAKGGKIKTDTSNLFYNANTESIRDRGANLYNVADLI